MAKRDPSQRGVWLAIVIVSSIVAGAIAAGVLHAAGCGPTDTLMGAVATVAGAFSVGIAGAQFVIR